MASKRISILLIEELQRVQQRVRLTPDGIQADLIKLRLMVGTHAFNALRRGLPLQRWRGTSPHNWWVEGRRGNQLWHSNTEDWGHHPDLFLFEVLGSSVQRVPQYGGHDGGHPFHTDYVLKEAYRETGV